VIPGRRPCNDLDGLVGWKRMSKTAGFLLAAVLAGCSSRPTPVSPYVPPETMYSSGGTMAAMGGVVGLAAGSSMMDKDRSPKTRAAGAGVAAGGAALLGIALLEAIEVEKERQKYVNLHNAFVRSYYGSPVPDSPLRLPPPPLPDIPFEFPAADDSPLNGKDARP
jgi:hypothetical protein